MISATLIYNTNTLLKRQKFEVEYQIDHTAA